MESNPQRESMNRKSASIQDLLAQRIREIFSDDDDQLQFVQDDPELFTALVQTICQSVSRDPLILHDADQLIDALKSEHIPSVSIEPLMTTVSLLQKLLGTLWRGDKVELITREEKKILKEFLRAIGPTDEKTEEGYFFTAIPLSEREKDKRVQITVYGKLKTMARNLGISELDLKKRE
ncbi:MAG: hypothetical protein ABI758_00235 [Candidatus Woesebacteria bacterium]